MYWAARAGRTASVAVATALAAALLAAPLATGAHPDAVVGVACARLRRHRGRGTRHGVACARVRRCEPRPPYRGYIVVVERTLSAGRAWLCLPFQTPMRVIPLVRAAALCALAMTCRLQRPAARRPVVAALSGRAQERSERHLLRYGRRRSLSLARRHRFARDQTLDRGGERADLPVSLGDSGARVDQGAAHASVELSEVRGAGEARKGLLHHREQRAAESGRALRAARTQGRAEAGARPEHALGRRHGRARPVGRNGEREVSRVRALRRGLGLGRDSRARSREGRRSLRHAQVGEVLEHRMDEGSQGILLLALSSSRRARMRCSRRTPDRSCTIIAWASRRRRIS